MSDRPSMAIGFVDVLIGAMASGILLFMAQAAIPPPNPGFGRGQASLLIEANPSAQSKELNLALRFRINGKVFDGAELARAGDRRVIMDKADGQLSFEVKFGDRASFAASDDIIVYLHDLGSGSREHSNARLKLTLRDAKGVRTFDYTQGDKDELNVDHPYLAMPLAQVSGQKSGVTPKWRSRP